MAVTGPDFISLQVRDLERSAAFYERYLGLKRSDAGPPHAVVFDTKPIALAVRDVAPGTDLDAIAQPGQGMALWLHAPDAQDIHDALAAAGTTIVQRPSTGRSAAPSRSPTPTATRSPSTTAAEPGRGVVAGSGGDGSARPSGRRRPAPAGCGPAGSAAG